MYEQDSIFTHSYRVSVSWGNGKRPSVKNKHLARDFGYYF